MNGRRHKMFSAAHTRVLEVAEEATATHARVSGVYLGGGGESKTYTCFEMQMLGTTFSQLQTQNTQQDANIDSRIAQDAFMLLKRTINKSIIHNDAHNSNMGYLPAHTHTPTGKETGEPDSDVFTVTNTETATQTAVDLNRPVIFDWGLAHVCEKIVPPVLKPLIFRKEIKNYFDVLKRFGIGGNKYFMNKLDELNEGRERGVYDLIDNTLQGYGNYTFTENDSISQSDLMQLIDEHGLTDTLLEALIQTHTLNHGYLTYGIKHLSLSVTCKSDTCLSDTPTAKDIQSVTLSLSVTAQKFADTPADARAFLQSVFEGNICGARFNFEKFIEKSMQLSAEWSIIRSFARGTGGVSVSVVKSDKRVVMEFPKK
eukprot:GDKI01005889.1.p1 GENE.GDKI01005889.1~~GDKI01005889.1.p1  ORF type:complete len:371 (-),score=80.07 GDKI01005889.1:200-1312(-)